MREQGAENLVMEVSSHAISLKRMKGSHFAIVGFTNLSQDHLDFHKDMDSYFAAKAELFTPEYADQGFINIDSPYGAELFAKAPIPSVSISRDNTAALWRYSKYSSNSHGYTITVQGPEKDLVITTETQLLGGFNLDNLLMAIAIASESGISIQELVPIVPTLKGAAGRLESVQVGQDFTALVDYAHSPDAVSNVLRAAKEFTEGRVIAVLGCGGDRDATKRPLMGKALVEGSDIAIFTSDNPRSESPEQILKEMVGKQEVASPNKVIVDRKSGTECCAADSSNCIYAKEPNTLLAPRTALN
jgi:UDP-N-acetylmuramoyl-L-alanyl-D-glutamate--2,6-diaminopimelate ligase